MKTMMICVLAFLLIGCTQAETKEAKGSWTNEKGDVTTADIKMQDGSLKEVEVDETTNDTTKKTLKENYGMKAASSIGKEWNEQAQFFEQYVQKNGIDHITVNDEGKAENEDIRTGCTIRIDGFLNAIEDAKQTIESQK